MVHFFGQIQFLHKYIKHNTFQPEPYILVIQTRNTTLKGVQASHITS